MGRVAATTPHRRAFRHEVHLACQVVRVRDFRLVADSTLDLSTRGMRVPTRSRVLTGEELIVSFRVPRSNLWIDVDATVARVGHGRRPGERGRSLGLMFHGMGEQTRRALFEALRFSPPADRGFEGTSRRLPTSTPDGRPATPTWWTRPSRGGARGRNLL